MGASREIAEVLRAHGHRVTRARQAVWEALAGAAGHPTVDELATRVEQLEPGTNLASVYRTLSLFEQLGLARETRFGDEAGRWELAHPDDAFHLVCQRCGRVEHHRGGDLVEQVRRHLTDGHGFLPDTIELTVSGVCAACAGERAG